MLQPVSQKFLRRAIFHPTSYVHAGLRSVNGKELRCLCRTAHSVVVAELSEGQEAGQVVLSVVHVGMEILLEERIYSLGLPIGLRVVGGTEFLRDA